MWRHIARSSAQLYDLVGKQMNFEMTESGKIFFVNSRRNLFLKLDHVETIFEVRG